MTTKPEPFDELEAAKVGQAAQPSASPDDWEKKAQEYLAGWKRAQADYQNLRKSVEQERVDIMKYANEALLQDLVPLMDHYNMAFKSIPEAEKKSSWLKGVEHIAQNFKQTLQQYGVTFISTVGKKFDPMQHESVGEVVSEQPEGVIVEEVQTGCMLHGKVIQPAKVKISKGKSK